MIYSSSLTLAGWACHLFGSYRIIFQFFQFFLKLSDFLISISALQHDISNDSC